MKKFLVLALLVIVFNSSCQPKVNNVIYIIGDGMGMGQISTLIVDSKPEDTFINNKKVSIGLATTYSADSRVTDSAAGGTALATGTKVNNETVGITPQGDTLKSILLRAQECGKSTGIIVSTDFFDATPADFYGNVINRHQWEDLAKQLVTKDIDIMLGDGMKYMNQREDNIDLTLILKDKGYFVTDNFDEVLNYNGEKLAGFVKVDPLMLPNDGTDYLTKAAVKGLQLLEKKNNENGFFLMIESSRIDHFGHDNDAQGIVNEMKKFNYLVNAAFDFADKHKGTLVVITADHETGGFCLSEGSEYLFCTGDHSGNIVPIFAYGPGSKQFARLMDNTEIPKKIAELLKLK